ncbi:TonB-dependent siderophore receptor [Sphingomonas sp. VDB2]|uniref:TonB-dependent siderophore receptor n=1 Tax=Sphingomonas sp. VDB2 TaxID=3228751 RepID=UPI003A8126D8
MPVPARSALFASAMLLLPLHTAKAAEADASVTEKSEIIVTGIADHQTSSATGLALTPRETPQSITIINRERIEDYALTNVNDLLAQAVGINVERVETDRTQYNSRGFDVTNFQIDGIGLPLISGIQFGDMDTALFENVETIRGANAIMTGIGNPSATINYVRKRPLDEFRATVSAQAGSWNQWRLEGDVSVPLTDTMSARLIYAHEEKDSYLDYNHVNRDVMGGIVSWQVTPQLKATIGYARQENNADGVLWGALPLVYSDLTQISYPRSTSTSADWTYWNTTDQNAFAELAYGFDNGWSVKGVFTYKQFDEQAKLLYAFGTPDKQTGLGVYGMTGIYPSAFKQYLGDFYASGPVTLLGREHSVAFGVSTASAHSKEWEGFSADLLEYPAIGQWDEGLLAEPAYPDPYLASDYKDRLTRVYGAAHLKLTDKLKAVVGGSLMWLKTTGTAYTVDQYRKDSKFSPYAGLIFDLDKHVSLYASYTDIYNPQPEVDVDNHRLAPAKGTSLEAGIKSQWFDGRLYATAAVFRAKQSGLADYAGTFEDSVRSYYIGVDTTSTGFELEVAGNITDQWSLSGGYTHLDIEDDDGDDTRTWLPTRTLKLSTTYMIPQLSDLKLGGQLRWQNAISTEADGATVRQKGYAVLDLMTSVKLAAHVSASVNVRNVTNSRYLNSLMWGQAYYAAPRSALATMRLDF